MANVTGWWAEVSTAVTAPRMGATALLKPPAVSSVSPLNPSPPRMSATAVMPTPVLGFSTTITVPSMAATAAMAVPAITNFVNAAVTAPRMSATAAMPVPAVSVSADIAAPRMGATAALAIPVVGAGAGYTDTFNRADSSGSLGADWITDPTAAHGSMSIVSNAAVDTVGGTGNIYAHTMTTDDQRVSVVMKGATSGDSAFIALRGISTSFTDYVGAYVINGGNWYLYRSAADGSPVASSTQSWSNGDTILLQVQGTAMTLKLNGSTIVTATVTVTTGRYVALDFFSSAACGFDSFAAQDI